MRYKYVRKSTIAALFRRTHRAKRYYCRLYEAQGFVGIGFLLRALNAAPRVGFLNVEAHELKDGE